LVNSSLHTHTPKRKKAVKKIEKYLKKTRLQFQILQTKKFLYSSSMICVDFREIKKAKNCGGVNGETDSGCEGGVGPQ